MKTSLIALLGCCAVNGTVFADDMPGNHPPQVQMSDMPGNHPPQWRPSYDMPGNHPPQIAVPRRVEGRSAS
jgi:hypothetical protein